MNTPAMRSSPPTSTTRPLWCHCQEHNSHSQVTDTMPDPTIWKSRIKELRILVIEIIVTVAVCVVSELLVWTISLGLSQIRFQFLSAIFGMLSVFVITSAISVAWKRIDTQYHAWLKANIDFINVHISVAFPIPIVMLNPKSPLEGSEIGRIIGAFLLTTISGWAITFLFACFFASFVFSTSTSVRRLLHRSFKTQNPINSVTVLPKTFSPNNSLYSASEASRDHDSTTTKTSLYALIVRNWAIIFSSTSIFTLGIPIAASTGDHRALDGFMLWSLWLTCVKLQSKFKSWAKQPTRYSTIRVILSTCTNPVLFTTLLMAGYTRVKATSMGDSMLKRVLEMLSSGTPLYEILTSAVTHKSIANNPTSWFGAGDVALSALECGIVVWGFKLFECRKQLLSLPGVCTIFVCVLMAAGNVYLSIIVGHAIGLRSAEALAFAARNTTLALAKPAMEAIGGNTVVNAALVVGNGIVGQLFYPSMLGKLANPFASFCKATPPAPSANAQENSATNSGSDSQRTLYMERSEEQPRMADCALTVATGVAVGVNGAAMGVSYLYEHNHPAAPYAVLAMTVYGISTVILTTVDPFKSVAMALAK